MVKINKNQIFGTPRAGDIYGDSWLYLPVVLEKGEYKILARFTGLWSGIRQNCPGPKAGTHKNSRFYPAGYPIGIRQWKPDVGGGGGQEYG